CRTRPTSLSVGALLVGDRLPGRFFLLTNGDSRDGHPPERTLGGHSAILRSMIGVPSIASSASTRTVVAPSSPVTVTRCTPIGFGRSGERVRKTPVSGMLSSPLG